MEKDKFTQTRLYKNARKYSGKNVKEAADFFGIKVGELSDIEHDRRAPSQEIIQKMEEYYSIQLPAKAPDLLAEVERLRESIDILIPAGERHIAKALSQSARIKELEEGILPDPYGKLVNLVYAAERYLNSPWNGDGLIEDRENLKDATRKAKGEG